jgi:hypothetical protein
MYLYLSLPVSRCLRSPAPVVSRYPSTDGREPAASNLRVPLQPHNPQPSTIKPCNHLQSLAPIQPLTINHQPSTINHQPSNRVTISSLHRISICLYRISTASLLVSINLYDSPLHLYRISIDTQQTQQTQRTLQTPRRAIFPLPE